MTIRLSPCAGSNFFDIAAEIEQADAAVLAGLDARLRSLQNQAMRKRYALDAGLNMIWAAGGRSRSRLRGMGAPLAEALVRALPSAPAGRLQAEDGLGLFEIIEMRRLALSRLAEKAAEEGNPELAESAARELLRLGAARGGLP